MKRNRLDSRTQFLKYLLANNSKNILEGNNRYENSQSKKKSEPYNIENQFDKKITNPNVLLISTPATINPKSLKRKRNYQRESQTLPLNQEQISFTQKQYNKIGANSLQITTPANPQNLPQNPAQHNKLKVIFPTHLFRNEQSKSNHLADLKQKQKNNLMHMIQSEVESYIQRSHNTEKSDLVQFKTLQGYAFMKLPSIDIQKEAKKKLIQVQTNKIKQIPVEIEQKRNQSNEDSWKKTQRLITYKDKSKTINKKVSLNQTSLNIPKSGQQYLVFQFKKQIKKQLKIDQSIDVINQNSIATIPTTTHLTKIIQNTNNSNNHIQKSYIKSQTMKKYPPLLFRQKQYTIYQSKISKYRDFIFQVNYAHNHYDPIILKDQFSLHKGGDKKYKVFIGNGNNSTLIKSLLLERRFWWTLEEDPFLSNFVWTQLKNNEFFKLQSKKNIEKGNIKQNMNKISQTSSPAKKKKIQNRQQQFSLKSNSNKKKYPITLTGLAKILNPEALEIYKTKQATTSEQKMQDFEYRRKVFDQKLIETPLDKFAIKVHNHLQFNYFIGNKKALFHNMRKYYSLKNMDVFEDIPLTFHIKKGVEDPEFKQFMNHYNKKVQQQIKKSSDKIMNKQSLKNIWIIKPGENSNRGNGIIVVDKFAQITDIIKKKEEHKNGKLKTYIIQSYIDRPFLYNRRKFDIRHYMLITTLYGQMKGYWYTEGYIRTSSKIFGLGDLKNQMIHLTNDAIQKHSDEYGKYEDGNKISYAEFQKYLDNTHPSKNYNFFQKIYVRMKEIATNAIRATYFKLDPQKLSHNFEIFGLDFMIDQDFKVWLIEINTNPCLEISSPLLGRIIPTMVQHSFRLSLDILFPPPAHYPNTMKHLAPFNILQNLKYELIFDSARQQPHLKQLYKVQDLQLDYGDLANEYEDVYQDEGKEIQIINSSLN